MSRIFDEYNFDVSSCLKESVSKTGLTQLPTSMTPVLEVYIGKTKELKAVDREFDSILNEWRADESRYDLSYNNPHIKAINELIKKQFGFKEFNLTFVPIMVANAFTTGGSYLTRATHSTSYQIYKNYGHYDKNHVIVAFVNMFEGLLDHEEIQGDMLTGLLIHEIGHIFDDSICAVACTISRLIRSPLSAAFLGLTRFAEYNGDAISGFIYNTCKPVLPEIKEISKFVQTIKSMEEPVATFIAALKMFGSDEGIAIKNPFNIAMRIPIAILGAHGEIHSDELAAVYGYSDALSHGLIYMSSSGLSTEAIMKKFGTTGNLVFDVYYTITIILSAMLNPAFLFNEHPHTQSRIKDNINKLKNDVKKSEYSPKVKDELLKDIEDTEKTYEAYINCKFKQDDKKIIAKGVRHLRDIIFDGLGWHYYVGNNSEYL